MAEGDREPRMDRRRALAVGALAAVALALAAIVLLTRGDDPADSLDEFLRAYEERDYAAAAALTDGDAEQVAAALESNVDGLDGAALDASVVSVEEPLPGEAEATVAMSWDVPEIGEFSYENRTIRLTSDGGDWLVEWRESVVHPELDEPGRRLGTEVLPAERAPILDRNGAPLMEDRPVFEVGVVPGELEDREAAVAAIAEATDADAEALAKSVRAADAESFVPAITLRAEEYEKVRTALGAIPGVQAAPGELPLAPTKEFARALLGAVSPATAEQIAEDETLEEGQLVGQWGLQAAFEAELAGTPTRRVIVRREDGTAAKTLQEVGGEAGEPLPTTLDLRVQTAAERALRGVDGKAALVAIEPATGDLLAVANRPVEDTFNRAMEGQYPPGSTFKIVTTAALLDAGLDPDEVVDCPATRNVGGLEFRNFEGAAAGAVSFREDFAQSCNTAFVSLADRLEPTALRDTGELFGLGRSYELALPAYSGSVPPARDEVEEAAAMFGQARILASPMALAGVAAAVVDGRWRRPRLLEDDREQAGPVLPADDVATLQELMRGVVTSGTGTALAAVPGEPIGKSGTAEYGSGDPPPTHAWFVAARPDVAVAVLIEDRPSGGEFAAPVAATFLTELG